MLVDGRGRTLYLFEADKGTASRCDGACASVWPPLTTAGSPVAGAGVSASKLGTAKRGDGTTEVTYHGHPLYTYAGDSPPGQTTGQGSDDFGAEWYAVSAAGTPIESGR
jgi:predicted lipoprotein with Yx(FWY)xxD motif